MNTFRVTIENEDFTKKSTFPLKWCDLLDERLDECYLSIKNLKRKEPFLPMSILELTLVNQPECKVGGIKQTDNADIIQSYDNSTKKLTQTLTKRYIVATDTVNEYPIGSGLYVHDIYFIEETKLLEGYICDSLMFTNPLGNVYIKTLDKF